MTPLQSQFRLLRWEPRLPKVIFPAAFRSSSDLFRQTIRCASMNVSLSSPGTMALPVEEYDLKIKPETSWKKNRAKRSYHSNHSGIKLEWFTFDSDFASDYSVYTRIIPEWCWEWWEFWWVLLISISRVKRNVILSKVNIKCKLNFCWCFLGFGNFNPESMEALKKLSWKRQHWQEKGRLWYYD